MNIPLVMEQVEQQRPEWSSGLCGCGQDEESSWWGTWCCWLVSSRTQQQFELGSSFAQSCSFVMGIVVLLLSVVFVPQLSLLLLLGGAIGYAAYRGHIRTKIREKLGIQGSLCEDITLHSFCGCCAVCQEAREANSRKTTHIDFCCGQELDTIHEIPVEGVICDELLIAENGNFLDHLKYISKTSQLVVIVFITLIFLLIPLLMKLSGATVGVLFLTFMQPIALLWFFYWRKNRKHALLDYVIKMFLYGFCMSTSLSMLFEQLLSMICMIALQILLILFNIQISLKSVMEEAGGGGGDSGGGGETSSAPSDIGASKALRFVYKQYYQYHMSSLASSSSASYGQSLVSFAPMDSTSTAPTDQPTDTFDAADARKYLVLAVLAMFVMAFVIAAGVEETMKHMAVRCTRFPTVVDLKNPRTAMVYLMAAAAGFACAENIEYVFSSSESPIGGPPVVGELFILAMRWCMPIHIICSVLQAASMSSSLLSKGTSNVFLVLMPAVFLHGSFDFVLFVMGYVALAWNLDTLWFGILSIVVPIAITIAGIVWAVRSYKQVVTQYESGFERLNEDEVTMNARL